ncbi:nickel-binding protein [Terrimonas alba]|uniref:nickel-binding protein n=1 Tax=Terrimonas alba TaxID=3349636 RepID=UPI0036DE29F1
MDVHIVPGVKARNVAEAHRMDLLHQEEYGCNCMTYWIDEGRESIFCLIEAPTKEAVEEMHSRSHGLIPSKIIEVSPSLVESFLGRIYDPVEAEISENGLKVFSDPSFRILLVTTSNDPVLLGYKLGAEKADELLNRHNSIIRKYLATHGGSEVEHGGNGFIISFTSATKAVHCALAIQKDIDKADADKIDFKMSLNAGEPIEKSNKLFGDTIQMAQHLCTVAKYFQVAMTSSVKDLISKDYFQRSNNQFFILPPQDEALLEQLFTRLDENWQNADFDVDDFCQAMAMSKSQLYRKTIALTGLSPNILLKEYRLEKAKELMKRQHHNIAQVTFDSGFTSPSYFTKCFKKKYGLLPNSYIDLLH